MVAALGLDLIVLIVILIFHKKLSIYNLDKYITIDFKNIAAESAGNKNGLIDISNILWTCRAC